MATKRTDHAYNDDDLHESFGSNLEPVDLSILRILMYKGRASNAEVGKEVGLSASSVSRRITNLEDSGFIRGYKAIVDEARLGSGMHVFVRVTLERQTAAVLQAFEQKVRQCKFVCFCFLMAGEYDYMLLIRTGSMAEYERVHQKELSRLPGVRRIESNFAVREVLPIT